MYEDGHIPTDTDTDQIGISIVIGPIPVLREVNVYAESSLHKIHHHECNLHKINWHNRNLHKLV